MFLQIPQEVMSIVVALGCGLAIGVEREHDKKDRTHAVAGVRTFALLSLAGVTAMLLGSTALSLVGVFVVLVTAISYFHTRKTDPGLTTEVAMVLTFLLGALSVHAMALAAGVAITVAVLLQSKDWLHRFVKQTLTERELNDALLLLASALVVLPILPDTPFGPGEGLQLRRIWALAVLVMAINAAGYVAIRIWGARIGLAVTGLVGGFVSSTATIASMGHRTRGYPGLVRVCAAAGTASSLSTIVLIGLILAGIDGSLFQFLWPSLLASGAAILACTAVLVWRAWNVKSDAKAVAGSRPFHFKHAIAFAALIAGVLIASALMQRAFGTTGVALTASLAGFADAHAAGISVSELSASGALAKPLAAWIVLLAMSTNTITKAVVAFTAGGRRYGLLILPGLVLMLSALWLGWWVSAGLE